MRLAIDVGNTRTKWGVFNADGDLLAHGAVPNGEVNDLRDSHWAQCKTAVISNVSGDAMAQAVQACCHAFQLTPYWIKSAQSVGGLINQYQPAASLGTDRWAAMVAAWQQWQSPCLVVNVGTALTIDAIVQHESQGRFIGGVIIPGLQLMQHSLIQRTAGIKSQQGEWQDFPKSTADAVYAGAITASTGAVLQQLKKLQHHQNQHRQTQVNRCIITGGDAALLATHLRQQARAEVGDTAIEFIVSEHLVLQGLLLIERENA